MEMNKKMVAAMAAVYEYIQSEEEVLCAQAVQAPAAEPAQPAFATLPPPNRWGMSGREHMMQMQSLMQMKVFNKLR